LIVRHVCNTRFDRAIDIRIAEPRIGDVETVALGICWCDGSHGTVKQDCVQETSKRVFQVSRRNMDRCKIKRLQIHQILLRCRFITTFLTTVCLIKLLTKRGPLCVALCVHHFGGKLRGVDLVLLCEQVATGDGTLERCLNLVCLEIINVHVVLLRLRMNSLFGLGILEFQQNQNIPVGRIFEFVRAGKQSLAPLVECCFHVDCLPKQGPVERIGATTARLGIVQYLFGVLGIIAPPCIAQLGKCVFAQDALDMDIGRIAHGKLFRRHMIGNVRLLALTANLYAVRELFRGKRVRHSKKQTRRKCRPNASLQDVEARDLAEARPSGSRLDEHLHENHGRLFASSVRVASRPDCRVDGTPIH